MRRVSLAALLSLALVAVAAPAPAFAADDPVTRKKVQTYLDLAADLFKSGDYEGALAELRRAEALSDLAVVRFNIARCLEELRRPAEASTAYQKYLDLHDPTDGAADREKRAREAIARLGAPGAATPSSGNLGSLEINCPSDGHVVIPGLAPAPVPCPYKNEHVAPGVYEVQVARKGRPTVASRAQVNAGLATSVPFEALVPLPDGQQPQQPPARVAPNSNNNVPVSGSLVTVHFVQNNPSDEMRVKIDDDEALQCQAPCDMRLLPGHHRVEFNGNVSFNDHFDAPAGGLVEAKVMRRKGGWIAVGAISVASGAVLLAAGLLYAWGEASNAATNHTNNDDAVLAGLIVAGGGVVIGVGGGCLGFLMAGRNRIEISSSSSRADRGDDGPHLKLVSAAVVPTRSGAAGGLAFSF